MDGPREPSTQNCAQRSRESRQVEYCCFKFLANFQHTQVPILCAVSRDCELPAVLKFVRWHSGWSAHVVMLHVRSACDGYVQHVTDPEVVGKIVRRCVLLEKA